MTRRYTTGPMFMSIDFAEQVKKVRNQLEEEAFHGVSPPPTTVQEHLANLKLGLPFETEMGFATTYWSSHPVIELKANLPDREDGTMKWLRFHHQPDPEALREACKSARKFAIFIRNLWVEFLTHEVDELLLYNGTRLLDPHNPTTTVAANL